MLRRKKWIPIASLFLAIQTITEAVAFFGLFKLGFLPEKYLLIVGLALLVLLAIPAFLLLLGTGTGPSRHRRNRRYIGSALTLLLSLVIAFTTYAITQVNNTLDAITETEKVQQAMVGIYVSSDDTATIISDAASYTFGIMDTFDAENTAKAVEKLNQQLNLEIKTTSLESMTELADALYQGDVDAIVLNEAYANVLIDTDAYEDFEDQTRLLYEIVIEKSDDTAAEAAETEEADTEETEETEVAANITMNPFIVYISGSDTRDELLNTSRSDVNILAIVNPTSRQILLLNTPRDYYIANPAGDGALDKLTHCGIYGIDCSMGALETLYDTEIDYYAQINFAGFEKLIDEIGGITVNIEEAFTSRGVEFKEGTQTLSGSEALILARERYSFTTGDNARGQNQMKIITAVVNKITNSGTSILTNYSSILSSLEGMFVTDLSSDDISSLVKMQLSNPESWNIKSFAVTGEGGQEYTYSMPNTKAYVMHPNKALVEHASKLIDKVFAGDVITDDNLR